MGSQGRTERKWREQRAMVSEQEDYSSKKSLPKQGVVRVLKYYHVQQYLIGPRCGKMEVLTSHLSNT